jgi:hypothetical protein
MKHLTSRELYDYWNRVRRGRPAPRRNEIEPGDIRRILADTFILEAAGRDRFPIRLAGTRMCGMYCREIKGGNFLDLWTANDRNAIATLATAVAADAAAAVITLEGRNARGKAVACEVLLLPLLHAGPDYDRILGSCAPLERPYWLGTEPVVRQTLVSLRLLWPNEQPSFMRRTSDRGITASAPVIPFPLPDRRRRGHLTVYDGGKR